jgi:coenzyme F420-reducing hydrogenase beta subunit
MLYFLKEKKDCTGCTACMSICPVNCISMEQDAEGFYYPFADDRCIQCHKCERICPIATGRTESKIEIEQYASAAVTKNKEIWKCSASGGAFSEICYSFGDDETVVFGARFDNLKVVHSYVFGVNNIGAFRKSKYVQSDLGNSLCKAEEFLKAGKKVIFSGTPCQLAGLKSYLGKDYEELLCIDLICHGVGSPEVFNETLQYYGRKYGINIETYSFRNKKIKVGNVKMYVSGHGLENKKTYYVERDVYNDFFLNQLCLRPSCANNCKFRSINRMGDITIADFKNKEWVFPKLMDYRNYSTIVVNSKKGDFIFKILQNRMKVLPCELDDIKRYNPLFYKYTKDNPLRNDFFKDYTNGVKMEELINKYISKQGTSKIALFKDFIPYRIKAWYRNLRKR